MPVVVVATMTAKPDSVEQWADEDALKTHSTAPAIAALFGAIGEHLDGAPDIKMLAPVVAGDPAKGQLRP